MQQSMKESVIRSYSDIAQGHSRSCGCSTDEQWTEETAEPAAGVKELNLGCGTPLDAADLHPGQTVLDLGSGSGREVFLAAEAVGASGRVIGLDMTPAMIDLAKSNAALLGASNTEFVLGEIENMPLPDGRVDRVISNCVINLTADKRKAFTEIHRVLRPGGKFAVSDMVSRQRLPDAVRNDPKLWCGCVGGALPVEEYLDAIRDAGFRDVEVVSRRSDRSCDGRQLGVLSITVTGTR